MAKELTSVRLDKWLNVARLFKTRSKATRACHLNRVRVNGQPAKAHRDLRIGDKVEVEVGDDWRRIVVVEKLAEKPVPKAEAREMFDDQSPPKPQLDPIQRLMRQAPVKRDKGAGRPSKKERRQLEKIRRGGG